MFFGKKTKQIPAANVAEFAKNSDDLQSALEGQNILAQAKRAVRQSGRQAPAWVRIKFSSSKLRNSNNFVARLVSHDSCQLSAISSQESSFSLLIAES